MATKVAVEPRLAARVLEPGPLALVTTLFRARHNVMTAGWLLPLSLDPPRLGLAVHPGRLTHEFISRSESFALSIPTLDLLNAVHRCGLESGRDGDKFTSAGLTPADASVVEAPLVAECVAHIECGLVERLTLGDHDLFVADVLAVSAVAGLFSDRWLIGEGSGLLHHIAGDVYAGLSKPYRARLETDEER